MKKFFIGALAVVGGLCVLLAIAAALVGVVALAAKDRVPGTAILEVDFEKGVVEYVPDDPISETMLGKKLPFRDVVEALEKAASDRNVAALFARVGEGDMGLAQVQEIREAVAAFRKSGKPAVAFSETFGEVGPGNRSYYLATAFDEIWLQPSGDIGLTGLMFESSFLRGSFDKLGITPRMDHRYEYKNAMNTFTERKYTEPHREAMQKVMDSFFDQIVKGIAESRKLKEANVRGLADRGPFLGKEAVDAKLVDGVAYRDEVLEKLRAKVKAKHGREGKLLSLTAYLDRAGRPHEKGAKIALVYGVGGVARGKGGYSPINGFTMGADSVTAAFRQATEDKDVKAILFRVDSPGGSYVASDTIWRETLRAKKAGKPVIVSMGDLAGSGGYFVAMAADKIVAQPGTITGSIGVLGGKFLTSGLWEKLGLSWDEVHTSANSTIWTGTHDYSPEEWARFQAWLDRVYQDFTSKAAEGRKLPIEKLKEVAKGRIWSGEDGKARGLVDELGGYETALKLVRQAAKLRPDAPVQLTVYPARKNPIERFLSRGEQETTELGEALVAVQPAVRALRQAGLTGGEGVLRMPMEGIE